MFKFVSKPTKLLFTLLFLFSFSLIFSSKILAILAPAKNIGFKIIEITHAIFEKDWETIIFSDCKFPDAADALLAVFVTNTLLEIFSR